MVMWGLKSSDVGLTLGTNRILLPLIAFGFIALFSALGQSSFNVLVLRVILNA